MSDDPNREARYLRAREVLDGAGWLFDRFVNNEMAAILKTAPDDMTGREIAYTRARVATDIKLALMAEVQEIEDTRAIQERREAQQERRHGRPNVN